MPSTFLWSGIQQSRSDVEFLYLGINVSANGIPRWRLPLPVSLVIISKSTVGPPWSFRVLHARGLAQRTVVVVQSIRLSQPSMRQSRQYEAAP